MTRWALLLGILAMACGGGTPEADSPDDYEDDYVEDPADEGDVDMGADMEDSEASEDDSGGTEEAANNGAVSPEDIKTVLQLVLDDEELGPYLKLEEPGRFPLKIAGSGLPSGVELTKSTKPVEIVTGPKNKEDAVLVFTRIDVGPTKGTIKYRYDIERMRGSCTVRKVEGRWELTRSRLTEYGGVEEGGAGN